MSNGWRECFGEQMCEDILNALIEGGMKPEDFRIAQLKEKYGGLRLYTFGAPQQVYDVITKYEYLSNHVCIICGKINVPMYDNGWISPFCEECAQKCRYSPDDIISPAELKSSFTIRRYSKDKNEEIVFDISDILEKIGYKSEK